MAHFPGESAAGITLTSRKVMVAGAVDERFALRSHQFNVVGGTP